MGFQKGRGAILLDTLPSHTIIPLGWRTESDWKASDKKIYILIVSNQFQVRIKFQSQRIKKNIEEIIRSYKNGEDEFYKCEEIITETEDGFLLTVHRLPNDGPPVLLQHGLLECVLTPRLSIDRKI